MNRRTLLTNGLRAAGAVALAASVRPFVSAHEYRVTAIVEGRKIHPAIQANIDYWMKAAPEWLAECPPYHASYYAVKEDGRLRVYAVKWNGSNLNDHSVLVPTNEGDLVAEVRAQIAETNRLLRGSGNMDIGGKIDFTDPKSRSFCCYVFNSPVRRVKQWQGSMASSLIAEGCFYKWERYEQRRAIIAGNAFQLGTI